MKNQTISKFALKKINAAVGLAVVEQTCARVAVISNPLAIDVSADDFKPAPKNATIADLAPKTSHPLLCSVNGQYILRAQWHTRVRPGALVVFQIMPLGGKGSNPLRMILQIALMVAVAWVVGPAVLGLTGIQASLVSAGLMALGGMLINALIPLPKNDLSSGNSISPTYSVALQGNSARIDGAIPVLYGRNRTYPDFAVQPHAYFLNNEQYYCAIMCISMGRLEIEKIELEDTDLSNFKDVQYQIIGPGSVGGLGAQTMINTAMITCAEVAGQELTSEIDWVGPFTAVRGGKSCDRVYLDMQASRGLGHAEDDGSFSNLTIGWHVEARKQDDQGFPDGEFFPLTTIDGYPYTMTAAKGEIQQLSCEYILPAPGRYEVRARRTAPRSDNARDMNDISWAGMRATLTTPGIYETLDPRATYLFLKIRASKQLSGSSQRKIAVTSERKLPNFDGTWSHTGEHHRNPALVLLDILRNPDYSMGLKNSRIDIASLQHIFDVSMARQDRFDFAFDVLTTAWEALTLVARTTRAAPIIRRGIYSFFRDEAQTLPAASFTPGHNIIDGSLSMNIMMPPEKPVDAIRLKYRDARVSAERVVIGQYWDRAVYAYIDGFRPEGVPEPLKFADVSFPGISGLSHAKREACYIVATSRWRRETISLATGLDGLLPAVGSLVAISHDLPEWGQSASAFLWDPATLTLRAAQELEWLPDTPHYVRVTLRTGKLSAAIAVTQGETPDVMILASDPVGAIVEYDDADLTPSQIMFGPADDICRLVRVKSITFERMEKAKLLTVVEDDQVHAVDNIFLPVGGVAQDSFTRGNVQNAILPAAGVLV